MRSTGRQEAKRTLKARSLADQLAAMPELHAPKLIMTDATSEGLASAMLRNGGYVAFADDEGASVAGLIGRYLDREPRVELANKGYLTSTPATIVRAGKENISIERPHLAFVLAIQPTAFLSDISVCGDGFLARFLFVRPIARQGNRSWPPPSTPTELLRKREDAITNIVRKPRNGRVLPMRTRGAHPFMMELCRCPARSTQDAAHGVVQVSISLRQQG